MSIGEKVTKHRMEKGWTKLELSKQSGLSNSHISQIENGKRNPCVPTLKKLSKALNVPLYELQDSNYIGQKIREYRIQKGLTMKDVEVISGLSNGHLCKIEKGIRRKLSEETLLKISTCLNISLEELFVQPV